MEKILLVQKCLHGHLYTLQYYVYKYLCGPHLQIHRTLTVKGILLLLLVSLWPEVDHYIPTSDLIKMTGWVENASPAVDDVSKYPEIIAVCVCLTLFMVVLVGLRVYVRVFMLKVTGVDDWIIIFSAVCSIIYSGLCIGRMIPLSNKQACCC